MEPIAISIADAGAALSLGRTKIYELIKDDRLAAFKVGRRTLVTVASIRAFVQLCREADG